VKIISEEYLKEQQQLHKNPSYGSSSIMFAPTVLQLINQTKPQTLTDYGAGKQRLNLRLQELNAPKYIYQPFDPAFPEYGEAKEAELVVCIDVLEHIEPDFLNNVLEDLKRVTRRLGFFTVHTGPAKKKLSDGRNAHIIQKPQDWWVDILARYFEILEIQPAPNGFVAVVTWLGQSQQNNI